MIDQFKDKVRRFLASEQKHIFYEDKVNKIELTQVIEESIDGILQRERISITEEERKKIVSDIIEEILGLGPIEPLMRDPAVTEIMINGPKKVYVERNGRKVLTGIIFDNEQQLMKLIYKILAPTRRRVDESYPYTDTSLSDGSRVNIIVPPLSLDGPALTIRKFLKEIQSVDDLIKIGTLDKRMADFLVAAIKAKLNIIFSGATGSGKTTTVGVLSAQISADERIITIEDTAELHLSQEHVVRLETRQQNVEGKGEVSIRDLFKNSLRMRPSRIILGEIRGAEALDMLQSMCSGHSGSLAVLHASSPQEVISRLETMIIMSGLPISLEAIHRQISAAVHLIVQQEQLMDGSRKITHITQVKGLEAGQVRLEDIFVYEFKDLGQDGKVEGRWRATGAMPVFTEIFRKKAVALPEGIFNKDN